MIVKKEKALALKEKMAQLNIKEEDIVEKFILGSSKGGQKINKTSSCVYLKHTPTKIEVKCQEQRSRELNRYLARKELCRKVEYKLHKKQSEKQKQIYKLQKQKKRRSKKAKLKMIEEKRKTSQKKTLRKPPKAEDQ